MSSSVTFYEEIFRLPLPKKLPDHPRVFCTSQELECIKKRIDEGDAYASARANRIVNRAKEYLPYEKFMWRKLGSSDFAVAATLAQAYALADEEAFGKSCLKILLHFAEIYPKLKTTEMRGRITSSTLEEAQLAVNCSMAYDLIANAPFVADAERELIERNLLRVMAWECGHKCHHPHSSNWRAWALTILASCGFAIGDRELIDEAINGVYDEERDTYLYGVVQFLTHSIFSDGIHWERSMSYSYYIASALMHVMEAAKNSGIDLWHAQLPGLLGPFKGSASHEEYGPPGNRSIKAFLDAPFYFAFPDGSFDCIGNSGQERLSYHPIYELAYEQYRDDKYAWLINKHRRENKDEDDIELSFWALVNNQREVPVGHYSLDEPATIGISGRHENGCTIFPVGGFAILRSNPVNLENTALLFTFGPYGSGHSHPDMLHFSLYGLGEILFPDAGSWGYGNPMHLTWAKQTIAHNTLTVDEVSQQPQGVSDNMWETERGEQRVYGMLRLFHPENHVKLVRATCDTAYDDVTLDRTLFLVDSYVLDVFRVNSTYNHTYDLPFHGRGEVHTKVSLSRLDKNPFNSLGYKHLSEVHYCSPSAERIFCAEFNEGMCSVLLLQTHPQDTEVFIGKDPVKRFRTSCCIFRRSCKDTTYTTLLEPYIGEANVHTLSSYENNGNLKITVTHNKGNDVFFLPAETSKKIVSKRYDKTGKLIFEETALGYSEINLASTCTCSRMPGSKLV